MITQYTTTELSIKDEMGGAIMVRHCQDANSDTFTIAVDGDLVRIGTDAIDEIIETLARIKLVIDHAEAMDIAI